MRLGGKKPIKLVMNIVNELATVLYLSSTCSRCLFIAMGRNAAPKKRHNPTQTIKTHLSYVRVKAIPNTSVTNNIPKRMK